MTATEITIGSCYWHKIHGNCIVIYKNRRGYWITVWGGPSGDRPYTIKGIKGDDLSPRARFKPVPVCDVCGAPKGKPHRSNCPFIVADSDLVTCPECLQQFEADEIDEGGICDDCQREDCEACDGTGLSDGWDDETGSIDCDECGGEGRI